MHREPLLQDLLEYEPIDAHERLMVDRTIAFVRAYPKCFDRSLSAGHITASAWLLDGSERRVLLTCHRQLGKWVQPGGHADGNPNASKVALREAREESGLDDIQLVDEHVFDVDVHRVPAFNGLAEHLHYDVRFLLKAHRDEPLRVSSESKALAWFSPEEIDRLEVDSSVRRMLRKWTSGWRRVGRGRI